MKQIIRKALWFTVLILIQINFSLWSWHHGFEKGYDLAMADATLDPETPYKYFLKKFDIKTPRRLQQEQERGND